jgi:hypothetical protein
MQKRMFQSEGRLHAATEQLMHLLQEDPRHGHIAREDVEIDPEPVTTAIKKWKA